MIRGSSLSAASLLLALAAAGCGPSRAVRDVRAVEEAYRALRDAILQNDDEAFFRMHSRAAREAAVNDMGEVRRKYAAQSREEKEAFQRLYHVTEEEFLHGEPRAVATRVLPWRSGWRERKELFRAASIHDVQIRENEADLLLEVPPAFRPHPDQPVPETFLPRVLFVRDPDGWRRKSFFSGER